MTRHTGRLIALAIYGVILAVVALGVAAHEPPKLTRDTDYDWRCVDDAGVSLANRQRQDLAILDCQIAALANPGRTFWVEAGRYRVLVPATTPAPQPTATATLSWTAPTRNVDGSVLTNGAGFKVYSRLEGTATYEAPIDVPGWSVASLTLTYPADGKRRYFAMTAYNSLGEESAKTNEVSKVMAP